MPSIIRLLLLFALLTLIFMAFGAVLGAYFGGSPMGSMWIFLIIAGILNVVSYFFSDKIVLRAYKARIIEEHEYPQLHAMVHEIATAAGVPKPKVAIVPSQNPNAFATGRNPKNAVVAVTQGILQLLDPDELKGVLAHEMAQELRIVEFHTLFQMREGMVKERLWLVFNEYEGFTIMQPEEY